MVGLRTGISHQYHNGVKSRILPQEIIDMIVTQFSIAHSGMDTLRRKANGPIRRNLGRRLARLQPLAAVSRKWRQATIPLLYGAVVCEQQQTTGGWNWRTNLELFITGKSVLATKLVVIMRKNNTAEIIGLCAALTRADFGRRNWCSLSAVQFATLSDDGFQQPLVEDSLPCSAISLLCAFVVSCRQLPRNRRLLDSKDSPLLDVADCLHRQIPLPLHGVEACRVDLHAQAGTIHSALPLLQLPSAAIFCTLTELSVQFVVSESWSLLAAAAPTLTSLRLLCIPPEHVWDALALGPTINSLQKQPAFPQLHTLSLHFRDSSYAMHQPRGPIDNWTSRAALQFPQLRRLSVRNASVDVKTVLGAFVRRKKGALRRLEIESTVALAPQLMSLDVGRYGAESVAVSCVGLGHLAPGKADRLARQVLHSASQSVSCLRVAIAAQLPVQLSDVSLHKFSQLRTLELRMPVPLAEVTSVVQQLPCLWRLKAPYIATAKLPINEMKSLDRFYALMTTCPPQKLIAPASKSLEIIHVGFWDYRHSARALCCHLLHFVVRLPTLRTLVHDTQSAIALQSAVDALALTNQRQSRWSPEHSLSNTLWLDNLRDLRITSHSAKPF